MWSKVVIRCHYHFVFENGNVWKQRGTLSFLISGNLSPCCASQDVLHRQGHDVHINASKFTLQISRTPKVVLTDNNDNIKPYIAYIMAYFFITVCKSNRSQYNYIIFSLKWYKRSTSTHLGIPVIVIVQFIRNVWLTSRGEEYLLLKLSLPWNPYNI